MACVKRGSYLQGIDAPHGLDRGNELWKLGNGRQTLRYQPAMSDGKISHRQSNDRPATNLVDSVQVRNVIEHRGEVAFVRSTLLIQQDSSQFVWPSICIQSADVFVCIHKTGTGKDISCV